LPLSACSASCIRTTDDLAAFDTSTRTGPPDTEITLKLLPCIGNRHIGRRYIGEVKPLREPTRLILAAVVDRPRYGYEIIKEVEELSDGRTRLSPGTLYGALDRLCDEGTLSKGDEVVVEGRTRRYYEITPEGRQLLSAEMARLEAFAAKYRDRVGWAAS
jgi:PadR family transcriptional regulator PadR